MKGPCEQLISDFCNAVNLGDPGKILNGAPFETNEVVFALGSDRNAPDALRIYTDFGPMPAKRKRKIFHTLLESNFIDAIGTAGTFGMSSKTKNIVYIQQINASEFDVEKLSKEFVRLSEHAKEWRITHYVGDVLPAPSRPRGSGALQYRLGH